METNFFILTLALAVFAISFNSLPFRFIFRRILNREPLPEDLFMMRRILGALGILAALVIIVWIPKTILEAANTFGGALEPKSPHKAAMIAAIITIIGIGALVGAGISIVRKSKTIPVELTDTEKLTILVEQLIFGDSPDGIRAEHIGIVNHRIIEGLKRIKDKEQKRDKRRKNEL